MTTNCIDCGILIELRPDFKKEIQPRCHCYACALVRRRRPPA